MMNVATRRKEGNVDTVDDGAIVRLDHVSRWFAAQGKERVIAVDDVSLSVARGEFIVLLGPSGCGKTTLLRMIAGLLTPSDGEITIAGTTCFSSSQRVNIPPERRRLSMMFQTYALWPHKTASANVAYPLHAIHPRLRRSEISRAVSDALDLTGVPELGDRYPSQMSGGQQQRVALARALVAKSELVLFDEPLSNVDARVRLRLRRELKDLHDELSFGAVYVTHDQEEAMALGDRIAVMDKGRVLQFATADEIYHRPASERVQAFVGLTNRVTGKALGREGAYTVVETSFGRLLGVARQEVTPGAPVVAMWRPEATNVLSIPEDDRRPNRFRVEPVGATFVGPRVEVVVSLGGFEVMAHVPWTADSARTEVISILPEAVNVFPENV